MKSPIQIWLAVAACGGKLGIAGDKIRMLLPVDCSAELKDAIRQHKAALLKLLCLDFVAVQSEALASTIFWTPDELTKQVLVEVGAAPGSIYTAEELERIVRKRVTIGELRLIDEAKRKFDGTLR